MALPGLASAKAKQDKDHAKNTVMEPPGFVLIEEKVSVDVSTLPQVFMDDARKDLSNKNFGEASSDLRAASRLYQAMNKESAIDAGRSQLKDAAERLDKIAKDVRDQKITTEAALNNELAQVLSMKAESDHARASDRWSRNEYKRVGYDLRLAADEMEKAAKWSNKELDQTALNTIRESRRISSLLIEGRKWTTDEVKSALNDFGVAAKKLTQNIEGKTSGTSSATTQGPAK
jgi:hypothetical protein